MLLGLSAKSRLVSQDPWNRLKKYGGMKEEESGAINKELVWAAAPWLRGKRLCQGRVVFCSQNPLSPPKPKSI